MMKMNEICKLGCMFCKFSQLQIFLLAIVLLYFRGEKKKKIRGGLGIIDINYIEENRFRGIPR